MRNTGLKEVDSEGKGWNFNRSQASWSLSDHATPVFWNCTRVVTPRHSVSRLKTGATHWDICTTTTAEGLPLNNGDDDRHGLQKDQMTPAPLLPRSPSAEVLLVTERQFWCALCRPSSFAIIALIFVQVIWDFQILYAIECALLEFTDTNLATRKSPNSATK